MKEDRLIEGTIKGYQCRSCFIPIPYRHITEKTSNENNSKKVTFKCQDCGEVWSIEGRIDEVNEMMHNIFIELPIKV